jgi:N-acyl-D-aspartate/D-glutamate deacylase
MDYDLRIAGGTVVDGTGGEPRRADVAVKDGRIVAVAASLPGRAERTLDASGAIVTPGFCDIHCHYDGQVSWDADLMPSSVHGVTTCVMGNCGVGFAPVRAADRARLIELMEGVEDIPGSALAEGIRWGWESFPEYMTAIDYPHAIDFAAQVPHDALRVFVMGDRAIASEAATASEIAAMRALLRGAIEAGAVGFSTGRTDIHRSAKGAATPASEATSEELVGLAEGLAGLGHGVIQAVSDYDMEQSVDRFDAEFDLLERMAAASGGHALSVSLNQRDLAPQQWKSVLERVEKANAAGKPMRVQVAPRGIGVILGLDLTFHPFIGFPSYKRVAHLPLAERVAAMKAPEFRARLLGEKSEPMAGDGSPIPPLADKLLAFLDWIAFRVFRLGERPDYEPSQDASLGAEAQRRGVPAIEALYDAVIEEDGRQLLYFPIHNYTEGNLENVGTMLRHPLALPALSDGGAHVGTICDANFPTYLLSYWARDRASGRIPLERAVQMLAHDTARYLGLTDRGLCAPGQKADLNVIDFERLRLDRPRVVQDLPAGGKRLLQDANGYRATLVSGVVIAENGRLTGARPGRLARLGLSTGRPV